MKKLLTIILISALAISSAACSSGSEEGGSTNETTVAETTTGKAELDKEKLDSTIKEHKFKGIVYITKDGKPIYESVTGKNENGDALKIDSPMFIGSVSKQFCAAGIMLLSEQGKLSVDDKLEKYYPEYKIGKDITLKNLLSMRSGILDMVNQAKVDGISEDKTDEENTKIIMNWIFKQELQEKPDTHYKYSNTNYFLLSNIIEKLTGQKYIDFMRKNFFEPLKMDGTGSLDGVGYSTAFKYVDKGTKVEIIYGEATTGDESDYTIKGDMLTIGGLTYKKTDGTQKTVESSATPQPDSALLGTWENTDEEGSVIFNADGTGTVKSKAIESAFTFEDKGSSVEMKFTGTDAQTSSYTIEDGKLTMTAADGTVSHFTKK